MSYGSTILHGQKKSSKPQIYYWNIKIMIDIHKNNSEFYQEANQSYTDVDISMCVNQEQSWWQIY